MIYTIVLVLFGAALHFVYESILAPTWRLKLKYELFELRDRLRQLKIEHGDALDDKHFCHLQDALNGKIAFLHRIDFAMLVSAEHAFNRDAKFRERVEANSKFLDDCLVPEAREIRSKSLRIVAAALGVNSGIFFIFLVPIVVCVLAVIALKNKGAATIKTRMKTFASLSERDLKKVALPVSLETALT